MKYSDEELIIKIKSGEIDFYRGIINRYYNYIFSLIKKKIINFQDSEDIAQNVFINFYKSIDKFDEKKPIKPYLYSIALNEIKQFYRKFKKLLRLNENIDIEDKKFIEDIYDDTNLFSFNLNIKEKQIVNLLIKGYRYQEISKKLKIPLNTVKSIVRRLRLKVKKNTYEK